MEELYRGDLVGVDPFQFEVSERREVSESEMSDLIKAQIATHPLYPNLLSAYIECHKIGAPAEMASLLEEIGRENCLSSSSCEIGDDPELDEFMETYCKVLVRYKEEMSKPFDEAATFLNKIEMQLLKICNGMSTATISGLAKLGIDHRRKQTRLLWEELSYGFLLRKLSYMCNMEYRSYMIFWPIMRLEIDAQVLKDLEKGLYS